MAVAPRGSRARGAGWLGALALSLAVQAPCDALEREAASAAVRRWQAAAQDTEARAAERLLAEYRRRDLDPALRGRLVGVVCDAVLDAQGRARLRAWREREAGPQDAWLWYRSLMAEYEADPGAARAAATDAALPAALRAAAARVLASWADPEALGLLAKAVPACRETGTARAVLLEAWAAALAAQPGREGTEPFHAAVEALLPALEDPAALPRSRVGVARSLARAFRVPTVSLDPRAWRSLLARTAPPPSDPAPRYAAPVTPTFFDLEGVGDRVVYVLDASSSMDAPLSAEGLAELRRAVPAARGRGTGDIPWEGVRTALQAVAEFAKLSLRSLPKEASFCVVVFGDVARPLDATPGLVAATAAHVQEACRELDQLQRAGSRGMTNLHGGLRRAFLVEVGGRCADPGGRLDALRAYERGPTTVFLLSDGCPTHDDWERGDAGGAGAEFARDDPICEDLERMNLLQACEVHAIAFGFLAEGLPSRIARLGGGRVRAFEGAAPAELAQLMREAREAARAARRLPTPLEVLGKHDGAQGAGGASPRDWDDAERVKAAALAAARRAFAKARAPRWSVAVDLAALGDPSGAADLVAGIEEARGDEAAACVEALEALARTSFGPIPPDARRAEIVALRRNWAWWWEKQPPAGAPR